MISKTGKKIFFINPPESLKGEFLESIFRNEFEIYLLNNVNKIEELLQLFQDVIIFVNIDKSKSHLDWVDYIEDLHRKHPQIIIGVFSKNDSPNLKKTFLMDIGIKGGYIHLKEDNWRTIELINNVLEANEARGRRKSVRLDFTDKEKRAEISVKIFTQKGYSLSGKIISLSSAGILVNIDKSYIDESDNVERVIFKLEDEELHIKGYLLKRFDNGNIFVSFEDVAELDKIFVQTYIFDHLQNSFKSLFNML